MEPITHFIKRILYCYSFKQFNTKSKQFLESADIDSIVLYFMTSKVWYNTVATENLYCFWPICDTWLYCFILSSFFSNWFLCFIFLIFFLWVWLIIIDTYFSKLRIASLNEQSLFFWQPVIVLLYSLFFFRWDVCAFIRLWLIYW